MQEDETVAANPGSTDQLSFRERMQRFNRMASETDLPGRPNGNITPTKKRSDKVTDNLLLILLFCSLKRLHNSAEAIFSHRRHSYRNSHDNHFTIRPRNDALYLFSSLTNKLCRHSIRRCAIHSALEGAPGWLLNRDW